MSSAVLSLFVSLCWTLVFSCPCSNPDWCKPLQTPPRQEFLAFGSSDNYTKFDYTHLTTLAWWGGNYDPQMVCYAHSKGARVVMPVGFPVNSLSNVTARKQWLQSVVADVKEKMLDGVNFDFEDAIPKGSPNVDLLTTLIQELYKEVKNAIPGSQVTFDAGWSPECIDVRCYDYKAIADATDFIVVMDYDEQSQIFGACRAGANSPYPYLIKGMKAFLKLGIPAEKLVMALPWYGHDFTCLKQQNETVCPLAYHPWRGVKCTDAGSPEIPYMHIMAKYVPKSTTGVRWDEESESPWLNYVDEAGNTHQLWFDNPRSLRRKVEWAKNTGRLRGVSVFTIDYIDYENNKKQVQEMWEAMNIFFKN